MRTDIYSLDAIFARCELIEQSDASHHDRELLVLRDHILRLERENESLLEQVRGLEPMVDRLERENAALREDKERLEEVVASFYIEVAPLVPRYPVELWENIERGRCRGTWAEDGSPYYFTVPHQLVPAFFALQRLAGLCEEKHALREFRAAIDAARAKEGQQ